MNESLPMSGVQIHRKHLTLQSDAPVAPVPFRSADGKRRTIERAWHHLTLIAAQSVATDIPEAHREWWYDLRRKNQSVCAAVFRFVDFLYRMGFPIETALLIPEWIRAYILERYGKSPTERVEAVPEPMRKAA